MSSRLKNWLKKTGTLFSRSEGGAAAVEFALVAGPFVLLIGTIIETGFMMFSEYTLQAAVQQASRLVRTGQAQAAHLTAAQFKNEICKIANGIMDCNGKVTVYVRSDNSFAALKAALPSFLNVGPSFIANVTNPTSYNCGLPSQPAAIVATYDWDIVMPGMNYLGNVNSAKTRRLVGFAIFQNEPFPSGTC